MAEAWLKRFRYVLVGTSGHIGRPSHFYMQFQTYGSMNRQFNIEISLGFRHCRADSVIKTMAAELE